MELKQGLVEKAKSKGYDIDNCNTLNDLCKLLPEEHLFIGQRLWCGDIYTDADNYDYANAALKMLIKLKSVD